MAKKRKLSMKQAETLKEYRKARASLRKRVKYYRDRGFLIPESTVPKIPKEVTPASVRNVKRASEHLFDKAAYRVRDNISYGGRIYKTGDVVYGKRGLKIYQKEERSYRKAVRALERAEYFEDLDDAAMRQLTGEGQPSLDGDAEAFDALVYNRVISTLMEYHTEEGKGAKTAGYIYNLMLEEEDKVGRSEVVRRFAEVGEDVIETLQTALIYEDTPIGFSALQTFVDVLTGTL